MSVGDAYSKAAREDYGYGVTWAPGKSLAVGDIITRGDGGATEVRTRLADVVAKHLDKTVSLPEMVGPEASNESVVIHRGVEIKAGLDGEAGPFEADVSFARDSSFLFVGKNGATKRFPALDPLVSLVEALREERNGEVPWDDSWLLVTAVHSFEEAVLLIARGNGAKARVSVPVVGIVPNFASINIGADIGFTRGDATQWGLSNKVAFYEAVRVTGATPWNKGEVKPGVRDFLPKSALLSDGKFVLAQDVLSEVGFTV